MPRNAEKPSIAQLEKPRILRVGMAQMDIDAGRTEKNLRKAKSMMDEGREQGAEVMVFPEMAWGYMVGDSLENAAYVKDRMAATEELGAYSQGMTLIVGDVVGDFRHGNPRAAENQHNPLARGNDGRFLRYNAALVWHDGKPARRAKELPLVNGLSLFPLENMTVKTNLPLYNQFEDQRHMLPLKELVERVGIDLEELLQPFIIEHQGQPLRLGVLICEDIWIGDYFHNGTLLNPAQILRDNGADILIAISSSPSRLGKREARILNTNFLMKEVLKATGSAVPLVAVNHVGTQDNGKDVYPINGQSRVTSAKGSEILEMPAFVEQLGMVDVPLETSTTFEATPEIAETRKEQRQFILETLIYGLQSFCEKRNIKRMVIGLSGGVDSALATYLAVQVLGAENILTVNMPTRFNDKMTKDAARQIAESLGTEYVVVPIEALANEVRDIVRSVRWHGEGGVYSDETVDPIKPNFREKVTAKLKKWGFSLGHKKQQLEAKIANGRRLVDENLQAKIRAVEILSNIAAKFNAVFSNNGNKTEMLQGFLTMDGDGRGFLQIIGDLWKTQIIDLCVEINEQEMAAGRPVPIPWGLLTPLFDGERYYDNWDGEQTPIPADVRPIVASAELSEEQAVAQGKGDPIHFFYHDFLLRKWSEQSYDVEDAARALVEGGLPGIKSFVGLTSLAMERTFGTYLPTPADFIADLERRWHNYHMCIYKEIQSPPVIAVSPRPEGYDHRRAQISAEYTREYHRLKAEILAHNDWSYWQ